MNKYILLIILLVIIFLLFFYYLFKNSLDILHKKNIQQESYANLSLSLGKYPNSENDVFVQDTYPITGINGVSNKEASDVWWYRYIPLVGSYEQITNNLRYRNNPDDGSCSRSEFCGTLYKDYQKSSNIAHVLPPVKPTCGSRINYYNTPINFLTYRNVGNILY